MIASGFAGLGYQIVWTQQFSLWLGHESAAVLAIVSALFGGLAVGSLALSGVIQKSRFPGRWYASCEMLIGLWCIALNYLLGPLSNVVVSMVGPQPSAYWQWLVSFASTFLLLLPATVAMGATLPAMERLLTGMSKNSNQKRLIGALYAANTLGATIGVLAAAFWLIPIFGLATTAIACAGLNLLCALVALNMPVRIGELEATEKPRQPLRLSITLALTGLLGIGYEVLIVRVISQVTENTVFTFALLLAVYLVGTAFGAAAYQRHYAHSLTASQVEQDTLQDRLFSWQILTCLFGILSLWAAPGVLAWAKQQLGGTVASALAAEALVAIIAFGPPTFMMGLLFSHLCTRASQQGLGFGRALGINTLGAASAPPLFGVLMVPLLGAKATLLLIATSYLALCGEAVWGKARTVFCIASIAAIAIVAPPLIFIDYPEGGRVVNHAEGVLATVSVVQDAAGVKSLRINNRQQEGSSNTLATDSRLALLPLLLHTAPKQVLFLGLGTGVTASSAAQDPSLQVEAAELLPEVIEASAYFRLPTTFAPTQKSNLTLIATDARRYVRASAKQYDVVISDNFHPARSGTGSLYSVEHFRAIQQRLAPGGLFCQWLPLHQLDLKTVQSIVQSFLAIYPQGAALLATNSLETPVLGLIAFQQGKGPPPTAQMIKQRMASNTLPQPLADFGFKDEFAIAGTFVGGPSALKSFAGDAPHNTDDHPIVNYIAPSITYAAVSSPSDRLAAFLTEMRAHRNESLFQGDAQWSQRLLAYWSARDQFIELGRQTKISNNPQAMLKQVREPLLAILRSSPDFAPAYEPLIKMALALAPTERTAAIELLNTLRQIQPLRPEANDLLMKLQ